MMRLIKTVFLMLLFPLLMIGQDLSDQVILKLLKERSTNPSVFSVHAYDITNNEELIQYRADEYMIPASSLKVITTFSAMDILGETFKFKTEIGYSGTIEGDGTLSGNVIIKGSGDPSLGTSREELGKTQEDPIKIIIDVIKDAGIKCIDGSIIIDISRVDDGGAHPGWPWSDVGNYYGAGVHALNIYENEYSIHFNRNGGIDSQTTIAYTDPNIPGLSFNNEVKVAGPNTGDNAYIYGGEGFYHKIIKGTIPSGKGTFSIRGSIPDPPTFLAESLSNSLIENGISHQGSKVSSSTSPFKVIKSIESKPLMDLISIANEKSINLYCEAFLRSISEEGSWEGAIDELYTHLHSIGMDTLSILQKDGSGLHPRNVLTSRFFTSFLSYYYNLWGEKALEMLPRASHEGTVRRLLRNKKSNGKAWLKSGYIGGVLTYTGYIKTVDNDIIAISIMTNNFSQPISKIRGMCEEIIDKIYQG